MDAKKRIFLIKYILLSLLVFVVAILIAIATRAVLILAQFSEPQASLVSGIIEGVVAAIAVGLVLYQLKIGDEAQEQQNNIQEAQFILQYNQAFIQDQNMCDVEQRLERYMLGELDEPLITTDNRQLFINYLVYLEGFAPLVLNRVIQLSHIDDLMAYRFFLAVNNPILQKDQLFQFPEYYRGCFKLYLTWKSYRAARKKEILLAESALELWEDFEYYSESKVIVRALKQEDDLKAVAELIYLTDPYIYPTAFHSCRIARSVLPKLINEPNGVFSRANIRVALLEDDIVGCAVVLHSKPPNALDSGALRKAFPWLPTSFHHTVKNYFNKMDEQMIDSENTYLLCLSVAPGFRGNRIGEMLLKKIIRENAEKSITLHVLADNIVALSLYKKYGFSECGNAVDGYALNAPYPQCYKMTRRKQ